MTDMELIAAIEDITAEDNRRILPLLARVLNVVATEDDEDEDPAFLARLDDRLLALARLDASRRTMPF